MNRYRFRNFELDEGSRRLFDGPEEVEVPSKAFDLLALLLRHSGRVVTRDEIFAAVWPDAPVSDAAITQTVSVLRRALGEDAHAIIRTVSGRGYAVDVPVQLVAVTHFGPTRPALPEVIDRIESDETEPDATDSPSIVDGVGSVPSRIPRWAWVGAFVLLIASTVVAMHVRSRPEPFLGKVLVLLQPASEAAVEGLWVVDALRGALRSAHDGNLQLSVAGDIAARESGDSGLVQLRGYTSLDTGGPARMIVVEWVLFEGERERARWVDRVRSERLLDLVPALDTGLLANLPGWRAATGSSTSTRVTENALVNYSQGIAARLRQQPADAQNYFERALAEAPGMSVARLDLADALLRRGLREAALSHANRVLDETRGDDSSAALLIRARAHEMARRYDLAAAHFDVLSAANPDHLGWRLRSARAHAMAGGGSRALQVLDTVDPARLSVAMQLQFLEALAEAEHAAGRTDAAIETGTRRLLQAQSTQEIAAIAEAAVDLAYLRYRAGQTRKAIDDATLAVDAFASTEAFDRQFNARQLLIGLRVIDDLPVSSSELDELEAVSRATGNVYYEGMSALTRANAAYRELRIDDAIAERTRALALFETSGDRLGVDTAIQSLVALTRLNGDPSAASRWLERLEAGRATSPLESWLFVWERTRLLAWGGDLDAAIAQLDDALTAVAGQKVAPARDMACLRARLQVQRGDGDQALERARHCVAVSREALAGESSSIEDGIDLARGLAWLGLAEFTAGDVIVARKHLDDALAALPPKAGYRAIETLGELAQATALVADPARAAERVAALADRIEVRASPYASAMADLARCHVAVRTGSDARERQCKAAIKQARSLGDWQLVQWSTAIDGMFGAAPGSADRESGVADARSPTGALAIAATRQFE